ncbi:MAG: hypothetical protein MK293_10925 [Pedosphaera sp.]|nr:hypothetical protein [Pedosphaera sp.]
MKTALSGVTLGAARNQNIRIVMSFWNHERVYNASGPHQPSSSANPPNERYARHNSGKNNRPNKQSKGGNNITFANLHHECKTSTTSTGTSDGMKTTNHCLKFDSFLLLSSQPDLVALGKENGYEFMRGELE